MYISYMFKWLYDLMQIKIPLVFSKYIVFNISIYDLFLGSVFLYIIFVIFRFFFTGVLSYEKASLRTKFVHKYEEAKAKVKGD